ncbi:MAG: DNA repair protein RadC [Bacteroidales bacterium]|nr:DNA repair protein RadC [Bacteroidales bacterium]
MTRAEDKSIKSWAADDRPREKLITKGKTALSNAELIAILIGSGQGGRSAVALAREVLSNCEDSLVKLSKLSLEELMQHKGIGEAKAVSIIAALELGKRRRLSTPEECLAITNSKDAYECFLPLIENPSTENFLVAYLNQRNHVIKTERISTGGLTATLADPKVIFKNALLKGATAMVICHNHPSGVIKPSKDDKQLTKKLIFAGKIMDIFVMDHLIIGDNTYFSFAENGMMDEHCL